MSGVDVNICTAEGLQWGILVVEPLANRVVESVVSQPYGWHWPKVCSDGIRLVMVGMNELSVGKVLKGLDVMFTVAILTTKVLSTCNWDSRFASCLWHKLEETLRCPILLRYSHFRAMRGQSQAGK